MPCIAKVSVLYSTVSSAVCTIISWKFLGTIIFVHTVELQWLEHLWDHEN